jgi:hypothetical protein
LINGVEPEGSAGVSKGHLLDEDVDLQFGGVDELSGRVEDSEGLSFSGWGVDGCAGEGSGVGSSGGLREIGSAGFGRSLADDLVAYLEQDNLSFPELGGLVEVTDGLGLVSEEIFGFAENGLRDSIMDIEREAFLLKFLSGFVDLVDEILLFSIDVLGVTETERGCVVHDGLKRETSGWVEQDLVGNEERDGGNQLVFGEHYLVSGVSTNLCAGGVLS